MSRNRINIDRELEKYLDDLEDEIRNCVDDQRDHDESEIRRLNLNEDNLLKVSAQVMEVLYFDDGVSVTRAIEDAANMTVNASIYATLERSRTLKYLPRALEDELKDDFDDVADMTESRSNRSRDRGREDRRDSRRDAARSGRGGRNDRTGRDDRDDRDRGRSNRERDEDRRREREEEEERAKQRRQERENRDTGRDRKVNEAQQNISANTEHVIDAQYIQENPQLFRAENKLLALGPVYWFGDQQMVVRNDTIQFRKCEGDMEYEKHRTDLYLAVRKTVKPTSSIRDSALSQAIQARDQFTAETIEKLENEANVVTEKSPTQFDQVFTSSSILGKFYGDGSAITMIQSCLQSAGLRYLPKHPVVMKVEHYPMWTMNENLTSAVEDMLNVHSLNNLPEALIRVSTECEPDQWKYFHDKVTALINQLLKVELSARPYLNSIITEWGDFAKWLETFDNGTLVHWFNNNLNGILRRVFHVYKHGSDMSHTLVDGTSEKFASISETVNLIYVPVSSDNFGAASATKLGRVMSSVTPKLYTLLADNISTDCARNLLVTQSDEFVPVYTRESSLSETVILMGDCNW